MRSANSKDKLAQMHHQLDRELQLVNGSSNKHLPKRDSLNQPYTSDFHSQKISSNTYKPPIQTILPTESVIANKRNEISELQRKLMQLQQKMSNIDLESDGSIDHQVEEVVQMSRQKIALKSESAKPNEDTARFLQSRDVKQRNKKIYLEANYEDDEEEDSEDYFQIQKAIENRKKKHNLGQNKKTIEISQPPQKPKAKRDVSTGAKERDTLRINPLPLKSKKRTVSQQQKYKIQDNDRKISLESQSLLKPKYAPQSSLRSKKSKQSLNKVSLRESRQSKKSQSKNILVRNNSRQSLKSNKSFEGKHSRLKSKDKLEGSFEEDPNWRQRMHSEQMQVVRETKKISNLQKELTHFKRLAKKYEQQLQGYRVMQIEFKQLKKHFAKSELIRGQQKKVIDALKSRMAK